MHSVFSCKRVIPFILLFCVIFVFSAIRTGAFSATSNNAYHESESSARRPTRDPSAFYDHAKFPPHPESTSPQVQPASTLVDDWNKIVFQSYRDGNWELYLRGYNDATVSRITNSSRAEIQPRLNWQTDRIVYAAKTKYNYQIFARNLGSSNEIQLTHENGDSYNAVWSPDGTQIVFQYLYNNISNIYKMSADGTNRIALTNEVDYAGEPYWSPDGTKIAFVAYRDGGYRVWVMNADGSNPVKISNEPLATQPAWSPDGIWIVYSADLNGDGFLSLMLMDADGSNPREIAYGGSPEDVVAYGWNPGSSVITATFIHWVQISGDWYWDNAVLRTYELDDLSLAGMQVPEMPTATYDMNPDWQSLDRQPPTILPTAPDVGACPFYFQVGFNDYGGSGVRGYYVQFKTNLNDSWQYYWYYGSDKLFPYDQQLVPFWGTGGKTYYFRFAARDNVGNISPWPDQPQLAVTIESSPPVSAVNSLPAYSPRRFKVRWGGYDVGGSGITSYDIQYRNGTASDWTTWLANTNSTSGDFIGEAGDTYYFRSRGIDLAGNAEPWPLEEDVSTTVYAVGVIGQVTDNNGSPVSDALVDTAPVPSAGTPSDLDGKFRLYFLPDASEYKATFSKAGYKNLPPASVPDLQETSLNIVLPPTDELVKAGQFESDVFSPEWQGSGVLSPSPVGGYAHTGDYAARLTSLEQTDYSNYPIAGYTGSQYPSTYVDADGNLHLLWSDRGGQQWYSRQTNQVDFSAPEPVWGGYPINTQLAFGPDGTVHIAGLSSSGVAPSLVYIRRSPDGVWSQTEVLQPDGLTGWEQSIHLMVDDNNRAHLVWISTTYENWQTRYSLKYSAQDTNGVWSPPFTIPGTADLSWLNKVFARMDVNGGVHLVWVTNHNTLNYAYRSPQGDWFTENILTNSLMFDGYIIACIHFRPNGLPFLTWMGYGKIYYQSRNGDGTWSSPVEILGDRYIPFHQYLETRSGTRYLLALDSTELRLFTISDAGHLNLSTTFPPYSSPKLLLDADDHVYLAWTENYSTTYLSQRSETGNWVLHDALSGLFSHNVVLTGSGVPHVIWYEQDDNLLYLTRTMAPESGVSVLEQEITVPISMTNPVLSFMYNLMGRDVGLGNWFRAEVLSGAGSTMLFDGNSPTEGWQHFHGSLASWSGQTITLRFTAAQAAHTRPIWSYLDEVSVGPAHPDVWLRAFHAGSGLPGDQIKLRLYFANQGGVQEYSGVISTTLPAGITFITASQPPTVDGQTLQWDIANLGPVTQEIELTLQINADIPVWSEFVFPVTISTIPDEIETANNTANVELQVIAKIYLPAISR